MKVIISFAILCCSVLGFAQARIEVAVSADTVSPGEIVELTYTFENGQGKFEPPDMRDLPLVSGPNVSSSFMISNGKTSSRQSYTYVFRPSKECILFVPASSYVEHGESQSIDAVTIVVKDREPPTPTIKSSREKKKF